MRMLPPGPGENGENGENGSGEGSAFEVRIGGIFKGASTAVRSLGTSETYVASVKLVKLDMRRDSLLSSDLERARISTGERSAISSADGRRCMG